MQEGCEDSTKKYQKIALWKETHNFERIFYVRFWIHQKIQCFVTWTNACCPVYKEMLGFLSNASLPSSLTFVVFNDPRVYTIRAQMR